MTTDDELRSLLALCRKSKPFPADGTGRRLAMSKEVKDGKLSDFRPQENNANDHTQRGLKALSDAYSEVGYVAPMTAAANGEVLDGSARLEQAFGQLLKLASLMVMVTISIAVFLHITFHNKSILAIQACPCLGSMLFAM